MSALTRIQAALRRISPPWPSTAVDTSVGKELDSIAAAIAATAEPLDLALDEVFPDTTSQLLDRWEYITRNPVRTTDSDAVRQARVLAVLQRTAGPRIAQLSAMLAGPLDCDENDLVFIEGMRNFITTALTIVNATTYSLGASDLTVPLGTPPWPGLVDDTGVRIRVKLGAFYTPDIRLVHKSGAEWSIPVDTDDAWYETRTVFTGLAADGRWKVVAADPAVVDLERIELMVSNDVDSAQIYNFFVYRDPDIAGDPDYREAERLFHRTAHGHNNAHVIQSMGFVVGESVVNREPVGDI